MKCQTCATEYEGNFCPNGCNAPKTCPCCKTSYVGLFCPNGCNSPHKKSKRPIYKKWWFWLIIGFVFFIIIIGVSGDDSDSGPATELSSSEISSKPTQTENVTSQHSQLSYEEILATYEEIDYQTLARNPNSHKGKKYKFIGKVIQVVEPTFGNTVQLRVNVTKETNEYIDYITWNDTIYTTVKLPKDSDRILEDDIIVFYGECDGLYTYESVLGSSISLPKINIEYWEFSK